MSQHELSTLLAQRAWAATRDAGVVALGGLGLNLVMTETFPPFLTNQVTSTLHLPDVLARQWMLGGLAEDTAAFSVIILILSLVCRIGLAPFGRRVVAPLCARTWADVVRRHPELPGSLDRFSFRAGRALKVAVILAVVGAVVADIVRRPHEWFLLGKATVPLLALLAATAVFKVCIARPRVTLNSARESDHAG